MVYLAVQVLKDPLLSLCIFFYPADRVGWHCAVSISLPTSGICLRGKGKGSPCSVHVSHIVVVSCDTCMCVGLQGSQASDGLVLIWNRQVPMVRWHGDPYCILLHARSLALLSSSFSLSPALSPSTSRVPLSHFNSLSHSPSLSLARGRLLSLTLVPRVRAHSFTRSLSCCSLQTMCSSASRR